MCIGSKHFEIDRINECSYTDLLTERHPVPYLLSYLYVRVSCPCEAGAGISSRQYS